MPGYARLSRPRTRSWRRPGLPGGPVKVQQRTSGGCWRTLDGLADSAIVQSYLSTAAKWGLTELDALRKLFVTGPWLRQQSHRHNSRLNSYGTRCGIVIRALRVQVKTRPSSGRLPSR